MHNIIQSILFFPSITKSKILLLLGIILTATFFEGFGVAMLFPVMDFRLSIHPEKLKSTIESAYNAWEKRDQFVETLRGRHIMSPDHELRNCNAGTLKKRTLKWLLDRMEETPWPHYLN